MSLLAKWKFKILVITKILFSLTSENIVKEKILNQLGLFRKKKKIFKLKLKYSLKFNILSFV